MTPADHHSIDVIVADDHQVVRTGLRALLTTVDDINVVGEAGSGAETIELVHELVPDVVLLDLQMPDGHGLEVTTQIAQHHPSVAVIVLTMFDDPDSIDTALRNGARGYLLKGADQTDVIEAIRAAARGHVILGPGAAERLLERLASPSDPTLGFPELTSRERDVLALVANGNDNSEIGRQLHLSPKTIANNVSNILTKLQISTRSEAIVAARRAGMGRS